MAMSRILLLIALMALLVIVTSAQETDNPDRTLKVDVQLVQLPVAVLDRNGRTVNGLTKDNFEIFEDGVGQRVTFFRQEDIPVSVGLLIDNSASMHNKRERVNAAALAFVRDSNPQDETFIVSFDDQVY